MWPFSNPEPIIDTKILLFHKSFYVSVKQKSDLLDSEGKTIHINPLICAFLFYCDRVIGNSSYTKVLIDKLLKLIQNADKTIQILSTGKHWDMVQKKIYPEDTWKVFMNENDFEIAFQTSKEAYQFMLHQQSGYQIFEASAKIFNRNNQLVCQTNFSSTKDVDMDAIDSVEAMFSYITYHLSYPEYRYIFVPGLTAQLQKYQGKKPSLIEIGDAPRNALTIMQNCKIPEVLT
jgi:hypothetical protein